MTTATLMFPGERAGFAALPLVKSVYREVERGHTPHGAVSQIQCVQAAIGLTVLADIVLRRAAQGIGLDGEDVFEQLTALPVFFSVAWVHEWENKRPWASSDFAHPSLVQEYGAYFEKERSLAYQAHEGIASAMWKAWLRTTPADEVADILVQSAQRVWNWNAQRKEKDAIFSNMQALAKMLGVPNGPSASTAMAYVFLLHQQSGIIDLHDMYLREKGTSVWTLMHLWERALGLKKDAIAQLFEDDSVYVQTRMLACPHWERGQGWGKAWAACHIQELMSLAKLRAVVRNVLSVFGKPWARMEPVLERKDAPFVWDYIDGIAGVERAMQRGVAQRVLVYGAQGIGKSHLIDSLLARNGYKGIGLSQTKHATSSGAASASLNKPFYQWHAIRRLSRNTERCAFVVDGAERYVDFVAGDIDDVLPQSSGAFELWSVAELGSIPVQHLVRFDAILAIEDFPIAKRIELSRRLFSDGNIATRVAQSVKTPLELCKVAQWCKQTHDTSWENIAGALAFHSKARYLNENKDFQAMEPVHLLGDMPAIAGYPALADLMEKIVHLFNKPDDYIRLGAKPPKGVLLVGPPGTGKTHFARHLSRKVNIELFAPDSSKLAQDPKRIGQVFQQARRHAPCILFFDEIDILMNTPEKSALMGPDLGQQKITNTFLTELDGLESNEGILVVGATHRGHYLDPAALRRLHDVVHLRLPDLEGRKSIWTSHLHARLLAHDVCTTTLAKVTDSFTGADIAQALNLGARLAAETSQPAIAMEHLLRACDTVHWGHPDGAQCVAAEHRQRVAVHEAGHALVAWKNGMHVPRITILPRARFLGAVHAAQQEGEVLLSREGIKKKLALFLGGICAEEAVYNSYDSGGSSDLGQAKRLVHAALYKSGLGRNGPLAENELNVMSEQRKFLLEEEESQWMQEQFAATLAWLVSKKDLLVELSELLLEKVEVSGNELDAISSRVVV